MSFRKEKKHTRSRLSAAYHADLYEDWLEHGKAAIVTLRQTSPIEYVKLVGAMVKTIGIDVTHTDEEMVEVRTKQELYQLVRARGGDRALTALRQLVGEEEPTNVIELKPNRED